MSAMGRFRNSGGAFRYRPETALRGLSVAIPDLLYLAPSSDAALQNLSYIKNCRNGYHYPISSMDMAENTVQARSLASKDAPWNHLLF